MKKCLPKLSVFIIVLCFQATVIFAEPIDSVISATGDKKIDVLAVQRAVDQGGSVLLKGVFDFGKDSSILISKDIQIQGELDNKGMPKTKITGGSWSFRTQLPSQLPPAAQGPKIAIKNIHFDGALWAPISLPFCRGAEIRNNKITNVLPKDIRTPFFGKEGVHRQQGIIFYPPYTLPNEYGKYLPGLISGDIIIADNQIDLTNQIPENTVAQGILVVGTTGANIQILRNRVENSCRNAIEVIDNYPGDSGEGATIIKGNIIKTAAKGIALPSPSTPNGIVAGWFLDMSGASDPARRNKIIVAGNKIETHGETSIGVIVIADGATITSNHFMLHGGKKAKSILHFNSQATITHNSFEGSGLAGIILTPWKSFTGNQNTLINNSFSNLKALAANLILNSSYNVVLGDSGKVADKGGMNFFAK